MVDCKVTKKPVFDARYFRGIYFTNNGRSAFSSLLKTFSKNDIILLPSYIGYSPREGSGVFDPITHNNTKHIFYKLNSDLSIDKEDFLSKIDKAKVVLVIHYFGFCQSGFDFILKECIERNKLLIEDCAHAYGSKYQDIPLGDFGNASFFSLHKFFPVDSGGMLKINTGFKVEINEHFNMDLMKYIYNYNVPVIIQKRRDNFTYLLKHCKQTPFFKRLPKGICPLNFPILIDNREKTYYQLLSKGIETTSLYHTLISAIKKEEFPESHKLSEHILNLPIHENLSENQLQFMLDTLCELS